MIRRLAILLLAATWLPLAAAAAEPAAPGPQELMQQTAQRMLDALDADREGYRREPGRVNVLVDQILLPHFDTRYSAQLVLAKYWRDASPQQRQRFVDAFYHSLLNKYGAAFADFTADRMTLLPFRGDLSSGKATVRTEIRTDDGKLVPVNYSMRETPAGWKAWDVTIEGISYVKTFRTDIGAEVEQRGLDAVIARLEGEAKD
jgi:phospholipid transport system substrate-binding protein